MEIENLTGNKCLMHRLFGERQNSLSPFGGGERWGDAGAESDAA